MKKQQEKSCELCNLPVTLNAFTLISKDNQVLYFCCEGCKNIYRMLHEDQLNNKKPSSK